MGVRIPTWRPENIGHGMYLVTPNLQSPLLCKFVKNYVESKRIRIYDFLMDPEFGSSRNVWIRLDLDSQLWSISLPYLFIHLLYLSTDLLVYYIYLSIYLSTDLLVYYIYISIYLSTDLLVYYIYLSIHLSIYWSISLLYLSIHLSIYWAISLLYLYIHLSIYWSISLLYLSMHPSIYIFFYLFIAEKVTAKCLF